MQSIDWYIEQVKKGNIDGGIERTKAYRFEQDSVVLVQKNEEDFYVLKEKIDLCKKQGINIPTYYEYKDGYILEELAKGDEFAHLINGNPDVIKNIEQIPYQHIEKYLRDSFLLEMNGIGVEPRRRNIFYDKDIGFTTIDVMNMKKVENISDITIYDVDYFFTMYKDVIPNNFSNNDYEKNISDKIKLKLIKAFENGHPLFKKYERWIFRKNEDYAELVSKNGIDLTLDDDEIKVLYNLIEHLVDKNVDDLYFNYKRDNLIEASIKYCPKKDLFGNNKSLEDYIDERLEIKQRELFPNIFENRDKCYKVFNSKSDISEEEIKKIPMGTVMWFLEDKLLCELKTIDGKFSLDDVMEFYEDMCMVLKRIEHFSKLPYWLDKDLKRVFDMIDANELMLKISDKMVESMEKGVDVFKDNVSIDDNNSFKQKGFVKISTLILVPGIIFIIIIILGVVLISK